MIDRCPLNRSLLAIPIQFFYVDFDRLTLLVRLALHFSATTRTCHAILAVELGDAAASHWLCIELLSVSALNPLSLRAFDVRTLSKAALPKLFLRQLLRELSFSLLLVPHCLTCHFR